KVHRCSLPKIGRSRRQVPKAPEIAGKRTISGAEILENDMNAPWPARPKRPGAKKGSKRGLLRPTRFLALTVQPFVLRHQLFLRLDKVGIRDDAFGRANQLALRLVLGAHAFGALERVDQVDRVAHADRFIGAGRLAGVAGGAVVGDE